MLGILLVKNARVHCHRSWDPPHMVTPHGRPTTLAPTVPSLEHGAAVGWLASRKCMSDDRPGAPAATLLCIDISAVAD